MSGLAVVAAVLGAVRLRVRASRTGRTPERNRDRATSGAAAEVLSGAPRKERYRHLFDSNPQPVWVSDRETLAFLAVNDAAIRHYGYSRDEFFAMRLPDLQQPSQGAHCRTGSAPPRRVRGTSTWYPTARRRTAIEVEVAVAVHLCGTAAALIVARGRDRAPATWRTVRQARRWKPFGQLAGGIAHDLNNVLTAVMAHVDLAVTSFPGNDLHEDLTQARSGRAAARR